MALRRRFADFLWALLRKCGFGPVILRVHPRSGLLRAGWYRSFRSREPVDRDGAPIPWWTYPFISFLEERLNTDMRVLEFGSGSSTVWLSARVKQVVSFETDQRWASKVGARLGANAQVVHASDLTEAALEMAPPLGKFDILVIDAGERIPLASAAIGCLNRTGVVIWDNTDGPDWPEIRALLQARGFRELSFSGLISQEVSDSRTTLFYREGNCLGV